MNITDVCIRRPVLAWMIMASTVVFGAVAATRIGISQFPDVDFPTIGVVVSWEGASPEVVENDVVEPIEEALVQVEGVRTISSTAMQGIARITVELDLARPVDTAMQDVQTKIAQAQRRLPLDIDPPIVSKTNPEDQPIMWIGLSGPYSPQLLADIARYRVREKLQTVPGVGEIVVGGALERNVRIWFDADRLSEKGVTVGEVIGALQAQHVELPAGRLETSGRELSVRVLGEALDLDTLAGVVVGGTAEAPVYLQDVAVVEDGFEDVRRIGRVNGEPAQGLGIRKQRGSNAVSVAQGIRAALDEIRPTLPPGMVLGINFDSTEFIEESVHEIEFEMLLAVLLTALVCWMFLGSLSSTMNVLLAIPMSLLGTVAVIYFLGYTLNTFTLMGLGLAVGIVVDDAIMVLENIFRHREMGKDRVRAAREGTHQITFAALAATLAVCAIFIPVVFMQGVIGRFFLQFGVTLCVAVLLSYLEAITLAPARCAQLLTSTHVERRGLGKLVDEGFDWLERVYARTLRVALRIPVTVLVVSVVVLAASALLWRALPREFVPPQDQSRLMIRVQTAAGSSIDETDRLMRQLEKVLESRPEVDRLYVVVGAMGEGSTNGGTMFVTLVPPDERDLSQQELIGVFRRELNRFAGVRAIVMDLSTQGFGGMRGFPIEFSVRGPDWDKLIEYSRDIRQRLEQSGVAVDVDSDYQLGQPELRIVPDRARAADLGVPIQDVATAINALVGGVRVGKFSADGRRIDVRARLLAQQRTRPEDLERLYVRARSGELVPLSTLVTTEERPALQAITRKDRERAISIFANVAPGHSQAEALELVKQLGRDLPAPYRTVATGASVTFQESMDSLFFALLLGILIAYMILAAQFNSFLDPVTVLTILPLSVAGAAAALYLGGKSLNVFSMIGLLLLMGIVKKNSIILVDYTNQARERGQDVLSALLEAGPTRLRPILMTSISTGMAAVPAALALGPGSETRAPMALAVIGGLTVSTLLSLVVVPAFYLIAERIAVRLGVKRHQPSAPEPLAADGEVPV